MTRAPLFDFRFWIEDFKLGILEFRFWILDWWLSIVKIWLSIRLFRISRFEFVVLHIFGVLCISSFVCFASFVVKHFVTTKSTKVTKSGSLLVPRTHFPWLPLRLCGSPRGIPTRPRWSCSSKALFHRARYSLAKH